MKSFWIILNLVFCLTLGFEALAMGQTAKKSKAQESNKPVTCKYYSGDIGTIVGVGPDKNAAFADAADQCFERHAKAHKDHRRAEMDMDTGTQVIDVCANLTCS